MFNTTLIDRRTTKQEVTNVTETNVEASGNISQSELQTRFINISKSMQSFKTVFSSEPYYIETVQVKDGQIDGRHGWKENYYKTIKTKIYISVKQVLAVGQDYTLEIIELKKENDSDSYNGSTDKNQYFELPTIL